MNFSSSQWMSKAKTEISVSTTSKCITSLTPANSIEFFFSMWFFSFLFFSWFVLTNERSTTYDGIIYFWFKEMQEKRNQNKMKFEEIHWASCENATIENSNATRPVSAINSIVQFKIILFTNFLCERWKAVILPLISLCSVFSDVSLHHNIHLNCALHCETIYNRFTMIDLCALAATIKPLLVCVCVCAHETIVTTMT